MKAASLCVKVDQSCQIFMPQILQQALLAVGACHLLSLTAIAPRAVKIDGTWFGLKEHAIFFACCNVDW